MSVIVTRNLTKSYRVPFFGKDWEHSPWKPALSDLTLEVREGETFGFLGPNGAGKTTTIHLLLNLIRPTSGQALLFGSPVTDVDTHRRLGFLPEMVHVPGYYKGRDLLNFYAGLVGMPRIGRSQRIDDLLQQLGLRDAADVPVSKYSKGMLQRIGLAQAVLRDPELLILDEPTSGLDPIGRKDFREFLLSLKSRGKTVFISSHILSEVESVCDRVAIMHKGQLKRVGSLHELSQPARVSLIVKTLPASAIEALSNMGATMTIAAGQTRIACDNPPLRDDVERVLAQHGVVVERIETEKQSLEDIFLSTISTGAPQ